MQSLNSVQTIYKPARLETKSEIKLQVSYCKAECLLEPFHPPLISRSEADSSCSHTQIHQFIHSSLQHQSYTGHPQLFSSLFILIYSNPIFNLSFPNFQSLVLRHENEIFFFYFQFFHSSILSSDIPQFLVLIYLNSQF